MDWQKNCFLLLIICKLKIRTNSSHARMDLVINALADIVKHYAQKYINTDDNTLNIKVIGLVSILITVLTGFVTKFLKYDILNTIYWFIEYKILKKKVWVFPLINNLRINYFNPPSKIKYVDLECNDVKEFKKVIRKLLIKKSCGNSSYSILRNITAYSPTINVDDNYIKESFNKPIDDPSFEGLKGHVEIAYINGYFIYLYVMSSSSYRFLCYSYDVLNDFMDYLEHEIKTSETKKKLPGHKIWEFKSNSFVNVGYVKPELTMDNYVSRYKPQLLAKLNSFRDGTLFKNNPYLDNNLGILLHGGYGTGKELFSQRDCQLSRSGYLQRELYQD